MKVLLDTNVFYNLCGIGDSSYSMEKMKIALSEYDGIFISELTILEMFAKYNDQHQLVIKAENYIANNKIKVHQILSDEDTIVIKANDQRIVKYDYFLEISKYAIQKKMEIEKDFFILWFASLPGILFMVLFRVNQKLTDSQKIIIINQFTSMVNKMNDETDYFKKAVYEMLNEYYFEDNRQIDNKINNLLLELISVFNLVFEAGKQNMNALELFSRNGKLSDELNRLKDGSLIGKRLKDKTKGKQVSIFSKKDINTFDKVMDSFSNNQLGQIDPWLLSYNSILFKKYLTSKELKIRKNDIFDSLFMKYSGDYDILSFDKKMISMIKEMDREKYLPAKKFIDKCK